jgi:hypothetical protein
VRYLSEAYAGKTWNIEYSQSPGWHGFDLIANFASIFTELAPLLLILGLDATAFFGKYQSYLASYVTSGNPNTQVSKSGSPAVINWPKAVLNGEVISSVLNAGNNAFSLIDDIQLPKSHCDTIRSLYGLSEIAAGAVNS